MPYRIRVILLVSSPYDAFTMEEDGRLMTRLFREYSELNLSELPTIIRAHDADEAFEALRGRRFDLVITMENVPNIGIGAFTTKLKAEFPDLPVVMFAFSEGALTGCAGGSFGSEFEAVDRIFLWTGDSGVLRAAIKSIEDQLNVVHDAGAGVRVILVVEDSIRYYTQFVSVLYAELRRHAVSLIADGINDAHKTMRLRSRPKVLLTSCYEDAVECFETYRHNILAVITDLRYPRDGQEDAEAGLRLAETIKATDAHIPILIQSADVDAKKRAEKVGAMFGSKRSEHLLGDIQRFLREDLGFGQFVFRLPDGAEVGRVDDVYEMEQRLSEVPSESIAFHARNNHFSTWLMARGMFMTARELRPRKVEAFPSVDALRAHLISVLRKARRYEQAGAISDFSPRQEPDQAFVRIGAGSIGGKGRSIAFVNSVLRPHGLPDRFDHLRIRVPRTVAIGTDEFEQFLERNELAPAIQRADSDDRIRQLFLKASFSPELARRLLRACSDFRGPIAVRSSSILEDSRQRPFAGIYSTFMLPNNHPDPAVRHQELLKAVKVVYASVFCESARVYVAGTPSRVEEERMAVVIQPIVGQSHGSRFYPVFSGVAYSYNYYPVGGQRAEDGVVSIAVGLGQTVVDGGRALQFSPPRPRILPQFTAARDFLTVGQTEFLALDLNASTIDFSSHRSNLIQCPLSAAEADGTLQHVASVYSPEDDVIRDNLRRPGRRVVTFNNILRWQSLPLAEAMEVLLTTLRAGFGQAIEMEFAVDIPTSRPAELSILQVRPQAGGWGATVSPPSDLPEEAVLCRTDVSLGNGVLDDIQDIIYVKPDFLAAGGVAAAAQEVGRLNEALDGRPYLLIGPGRWGSSDPHLGIPVEWAQISGARIIVETTFEGRAVEPSQGSHFFNNLLSMQVGYLTLSAPSHRTTSADPATAKLDRAWIAAQQTGHDLDTIRHVTLEGALTAYLEGPKGAATIIKPNY